VAFIGVVSLVGLYRMDAFKTIENNTPEFCETFNMDGSAEDIEIDYERGYAYLSLQDRAALISGENVQGRIVKINLNKSPYEITSALTEQPEHLRPHGISLYIDDNGRRHLAVINHPKNRGTEPENVDLFSEENNGVFKYVETISDPLFKSPNDVLLVAANKFYVGNDKGGESSLDKIQENLGRPMSTIAYFDGSSTSIAARNLSQVSGIIGSKDGNFIFASETTAKRIAVFNRNSSNGELERIYRIKLNGSPDNINVSEDGSLIVANIPKVMALIQHFIALQKGEIKPSPSQVVQIKYKTVVDRDHDDSNLWGSRVTDVEKNELFLSDGTDISTASVGAIWDNRLFIGSIDDKKMLICDL